MKNLGELVEKWMHLSDINPTQMAELVRTLATTDEGKRVKRQHIAQLLEHPERKPRYLADLARAMGTTMDALMQLQMPAPFGSPASQAPPPKPATGYSDLGRKPTESDWATLDAVRFMMPSSELEDIVRRYTELLASTKARLMQEQKAAALGAAANAVANIAKQAEAPNTTRVEKKTTSAFNLASKVKKPRKDTGT